MRLNVSSPVYPKDIKHNNKHEALAARMATKDVATLYASRTCPLTKSNLAHMPSREREFGFEARGLTTIEETQGSWVVGRHTSVMKMANSYFELITVAYLVYTIS
ncbi:hypothetical protein RF11_00241 [Thelohanellus kitauei]|uniref:Uncharacterized protein n=1 Tax=Thelohanellus kitauei TaxID=669202 RepID=A0A0C2N545_THEKT|nr:hypothetical protein RF11_00241 [Thelohanellus kitauei]